MSTDHSPNALDGLIFGYRYVKNASGIIVPEKPTLELSSDFEVTTGDDATEVALAVGARPYRREITVDAGAGSLNVAARSTTINLGAVVPDNSMPIGLNVAIGGVLSGGGVTSAVLDVGPSGDPDAILDGVDLLTSPPNGQANVRDTLGISPWRMFSFSAQLIATVTADVNLNTITSGRFTITIALAVLPT